MSPGSSSPPLYGPGHQDQPAGRPPLSGLAVASLVLSLLICLAPVGLVLGIVALVRIPRNGKRGKGLAIAGTSVGGAVAGLAALLLVIGGGPLTAWMEAGSDVFGARGRTSGSIATLKAGDCFTPKESLLLGEDVRITDPSADIVPCDEPHLGEVYGTFRLAGDHAISDPGTIAEQAREGCVPLLHDFALDTAALPLVDTSFYYPESVSGTGGDRTVWCWIGAEDGLPEKSLRQDPSGWSEDQLAYLKAMRPLSEASVSAPESATEDDLAAATAWAGRMARGEAESARLLRAVDGFPAEVRGPVAGLANRLDALSAVHLSAAKARTPAEFDKRWESVGEVDEYEEEWEARVALGLPVEDEDEDEGEGEAPAG
ncbi:DUF4190 domain-containing protein [Streptomyces sp. NPDC059452]|uniref:DUF4190 domain-containing protein n=1 Tax=Streptomyces sp. NPDC059452 TaxID=3346835 RepID=UPI0036833453